MTKQMFLVGMLLSSLVTAAPAAPALRGHVLCSSTWPTQKGFDLVVMPSAKNRAYQGYFDVTDTLRVAATYHAKDHDFGVTVSRLNEDRETDLTVATMSVKLVPGQFWRFTLSHEASAYVPVPGLDLICEVLWH